MNNFEARLSRLESQLKQCQDNLISNEASIPNWGYINAANSPYNAKGDGTTDDTHAIQSALNDASRTGGFVLLPGGNYLVRTHLTVPPNTVLRGVNEITFRTWGYGNNTFSGTTLLAIEGKGNPNGTPFISLKGPNSGVEGLNVFYPQQTETSPPIAYPWTIRGSGDDCTVKDVLLVNSYMGIDFGTNPCGRHFISGVYGQVLKEGIFVDQCYDIGRIKHVHFWPFWTENMNVRNWVNQNGFTFVFHRSDWEVVEDIFSFGYHTGMTFRAGAKGSLNGQFTNINFDNVDVGLDIYDTQPPGIHFSNLNLANAGGGNIRVLIIGHAGAEAWVTIEGYSCWGQEHSCLLWQNPGVISISNSLITQWDVTDTQPALTVSAGQAQLRGIYFNKQGSPKTAIQFTGGAVGIVTGNILNGNSMDIPGGAIVSNNLK